MNKKLLIIAITSILTFTGNSTRSFHSQNVPLVESRKIMQYVSPLNYEKPLSLEEQDSIEYEILKSKTQEDILYDLLSIDRKYDAGIVILAILEKGNNERYSLKELHSIFWNQVMEGLKNDTNWEARADLKKQYEETFPKN